MKAKFKVGDYVYALDNNLNSEEDYNRKGIIKRIDASNVDKYPYHIAFDDSELTLWCGKLEHVDTVIEEKTVRDHFDTGAQRDTQEGKPRYDLISPLALKRIANHMARGAEHYGEHNWEKGIPISRCYASLLRHIFAYGEGRNDEDHLAAACFNAMAILHFEEDCRADMMDMPFKLHDSARALTEAIESHNETKPLRKTKKKIK